MVANKLIFDKLNWFDKLRFKSFQMELKGWLTLKRSVTTKMGMVLCKDVSFSTVYWGTTFYDSASGSVVLS